MIHPSPSDPSSFVEISMSRRVGFLLRNPSIAYRELPSSNLRCHPWPSPSPFLPTSPLFLPPLSPSWSLSYPFPVFPALCTLGHPWQQTASQPACLPPSHPYNFSSKKLECETYFHLVWCSLLWVQTVGSEQLSGGWTHPGAGRWCAPTPQKFLYTQDPFVPLPMYLFIWLIIRTL